MNYPLLFRLLSYILLALVAAFIGSVAVGLGYGEWRERPGAIHGFAVATAVAVSLAAALWRLGRRADIRMFRKEALALIGIGWLLASLIGAMPFVLILENCSFPDAFFESASGFTTTGASVFTGFETWPRSLLFFRCLTQWFGGLGVVVFFVAILGSLGAGGKILFSNESSGMSTDVDSGRFQSGILQLMYLYLGLSLACTLILRWLGMDWYDAACHTFTTLSTGGYSTRSASIAAFSSPAIEWVLILFMALGGTSFFVMIRLFRGDLRTVSRNSEVPVYYAVLCIASLLIFFEIVEQTGSRDFHTVARTAAFQVVSIMTTTGFTTADYDTWLPSARVILIALMIIGGCTGSTAGGVKILRFVILGRLMSRNIEHSFHTKVVRPIRVNGRKLTPTTEESVTSYLLLIGFTTFAGIIVVSLFEHRTSLASTLSIVAATLYNIGPGFDQIGPTRNFAFLQNHTKMFLSLLMIMGRLELYAILALFSPSLWKRFS